jgi:hypothetical protein
MTTATGVTEAAAAPAAPTSTGAVIDFAAERAARVPQGPLARYWQPDKGALDTDKLSADFIERDAAYARDQERAKIAAADPSVYQLTPLPTFQAPPDVKVVFDEAAPVTGPILTEFRKVAHELQLPQAGVSRLLGLQAQFQVGFARQALSEHQTMVAGEVQKMGGDAAVKARHEPIEKFLQTHFRPDEQSEARLLLETEVGTRVLEMLIAKGIGGVMPPRSAPTTAGRQQQAQTVAERWYGATTPVRR